MHLSELKPLQKNPFKSRGDKQIEAIGRSIQEFEKMMEIRKIVIDEDFNILGGNKRYFALKALGRVEIPDSWVDRVEGLTEAQKREFIVKDNAHWGSEWDMDMLNDWGVDVEDWGVEVDWELDKPEAIEDDYEMPEEIVTDIVVGDLFEIGVHRLLCGDSTDREQVERLMGGEKAELVITDPPYGVSYSDKNGFLNSIDKGNRIQSEIKNDNLTKGETKNIWRLSFENMNLSMAPGAVVYCFMPQGGDQMMMMMMMMEAGIEPKHELIWLKNNHVLGRVDYAYKHEPILYAWKDGGHKFYGDFQTSIIEVQRPTKSDLHPTMKPVKLIEILINNSSLESGLVLDIFLGSGSTMVAAHQLNRRCYGLELEPKYVEIIVQRMLKLDNTLKIIKNNIDVTEIFMNKLK